MNATQSLEMAQYRVASHYIGKLRQIDVAIQGNRENSAYWFQLIEQDWTQIKHWQQWSVLQSKENLQNAKLCMEFATEGHEYFSVRQSTLDRLIWYRAALVAAQQTGDERRERQLLYSVGSTAYQIGNFEEAEQCAKRLLDLGEIAKDYHSLGDGWFITGNLHSHRTELDAAEAAFRKAAAYFERSKAELMLGHAEQGIARVLIFRGHYEEALVYATHYLSIIQAYGREADFSLAFQTLSNIHTRLGNLVAAKEYALKAVENSRRLGYVRMIPSNLLILGYAELGLNELESAWEHFQETITASRINSAKFDLAAATYSLGDVRIRQNNFTEAMNYFEQALALANESHIAAYQSLCSIVIAYIQATMHEVNTASLSLRVGAQIALQINSNILLAKALISAVKLCQEMGKLTTAAEWSGLLVMHSEHAEPKIVDEICNQLEVVLGSDSYRAAFKRGQQFRLDTTITELISLIDASVFKS